jgi:hypothetical protein
MPELESRRLICGFTLDNIEDVQQTFKQHNTTTTSIVSSPIQNFMSATAVMPSLYSLASAFSISTWDSSILSKTPF